MRTDALRNFRAKPVVTHVFRQASALRSDERLPRGLDGADGQAPSPARLCLELPNSHESRTSEGSRSDDEARFPALPSSIESLSSRPIRSSARSSFSATNTGTLRLSARTSRQETKSSSAFHGSRNTFRSASFLMKRSPPKRVVWMQKKGAKKAAAGKPGSRRPTATCCHRFCFLALLYRKSCSSMISVRRRIALISVTLQATLDFA